VEKKGTYLVVLATIALLAMAGIGTLLWMQFAPATASSLPDHLAAMMAPTDPCGCSPGSSEETDIPLGLVKTKSIVNTYLNRLNVANLVLKEIIVYNNNSYARIADSSTGINVMELFIDTETGIVISEYSSSFNWNQMYPSIPDSRAIGRIGLAPAGPGVDTIANPLIISPEQAETIASQYLVRFKINARLSKNIEVFYGYYVIEYQEWGKVVGMISINGYTGEAFRHDWHQTFIARKTY
jgi:hypothetical protein